MPPFAEHLNLPWYERDGLMSYIDSLKCQDFLNDTDEHFQKAEVTNFNIILHKCRGDPLQKDLKTYRSVQKKRSFWVQSKVKEKYYFICLTL